MIVAFVHPACPCTSTTGNSVITRDFQLSAWFAGLHLAISAVPVDQDLISWLRPWYSFASPHSDGPCRKIEGMDRLALRGSICISNSEREIFCQIELE